MHADTKKGGREEETGLDFRHVKRGNNSDGVKSDNCSWRNKVLYPMRQK